MSSVTDSWYLACRTLAPAAGDAAIAATGSGIEGRWREPHRHYHTIVHLEEMLRVLHPLSADPPGHAVAVLAAWFHDAVYDPRAGGNEAASARLADRDLTDLGVAAEARAAVAGLVLMTADHAVPREDSLSAWFHDADLWILSADPGRFDEYCAQVRAEYAHVPDAAYAAGRAAILRPLLERPRLYATTAAHRDWDGPARTNLRRELARLGG